MKDTPLPRFLPSPDARGIYPLSGRLTCMCCRIDLGSSGTKDDSHGLCDKCFANWDPVLGCPDGSFDDGLDFYPVDLPANADSPPLRK